MLWLFSFFGNLAAYCGEFPKETEGAKSCCVTRLTIHFIITDVYGDENANFQKLFDIMSVMQKRIEHMDSQMGRFVNEITEVKSQISSIKKGNEEIRSKQWLNNTHVARNLI